MFFSNYVQQSKIEDLNIKGKILLILLIVGIPLVMSTQVMDKGLVPRFLFLSASLLLGLVFYFKEIKNKPTFNYHWFDGLFLAWIALNFVSLIWAPNKSEAIFFVQIVALSWFTFFAFRHLLAQDGAKANDFINKSIAAISLLIFCIVSYQFLELILSGNINAKKATYEIVAASSHRNLLGSFLSFLVFLNLAAWPQTKKIWKKSHLFFAFAFLFFLILLQVRAVYVAMGLCAIVAFIVLFFSEYKKQLPFKKIGLAVLVLGLVVLLTSGITGNLGGLLDRLNFSAYTNSFSAKERLTIWGKTFELIKENMFLGLGPGNWKLYFSGTGLEELTRASYQSKGILRPHNDYLWVWSELGIMGFALFTSLMLSGVFLGFKNFFNKTLNSQNRLSLLMISLGILAFVIISFFDFPRERIEHQTYWMLFLALLFYYTNNLTLADKKVVNSNIKILPIAISAMIILSSLFIGVVRYKGELASDKIMKLNGKKRWAAIIKEFKGVPISLYNVDPFANPIQFFEGNAFYELAKYDQAFESYSQAIEAFPTHHQSLCMLGNLYLKKKENDKAGPLLEQAIAINPFHEITTNNLAFYYFDTKQFDKLKALLDKTTIKNEYLDNIKDSLKK